MASKSKEVKLKRVKAPKGSGRKARRQSYKAAERWKTNKQRRKESLARHLLLAKARRWRNHPTEASEADRKAYLRLHPSK